MEHTKYWSDRCKLAEHIVFKSVVENKNEKVGRALDKYETFLEIKGCKDYVK